MVSASTAKPAFPIRRWNGNKAFVGPQEPHLLTVGAARRKLTRQAAPQRMHLDVKKSADFASLTHSNVPLQLATSLSPTSALETIATAVIEDNLNVKKKDEIISQ